MKKQILALLAASLCAAAATAQPWVKNLNNYGKSTTIVLVDDELPAEAKVGSAVFHNDGAALSSKSVKVERRDGKTLIRMEFKRCTTFRNMSVSLEIDGKTVRVPIEPSH